jgi:hypothetical protein
MTAAGAPSPGAPATGRRPATATGTFLQSTYYDIDVAIILISYGIVVS